MIRAFFSNGYSQLIVGKWSRFGTTNSHFIKPYFIVNIPKWITKLIRR